MSETLSKNSLLCLKTSSIACCLILILDFVGMEISKEVIVLCFSSFVISSVFRLILLESSFESLKIETDALSYNHTVLMRAANRILDEEDMYKEGEEGTSIRLLRYTVRAIERDNNI